MKWHKPLSVIALVAITVGLGIYILDHLRRPREQNDFRPPHVKCMSNLKQVGIGLRQYALDYDGLFPERISAPYGDYCSSERVFQCPSMSRFHIDTYGLGEDEIRARIHMLSDYRIVEGLTDDSPDDMIFVYCVSSLHEEGFTFCRLGGSAECVPRDEFWKLLRQQQQKAIDQNRAREVSDEQQ